MQGARIEQMAYSEESPEDAYVEHRFLEAVGTALHEGELALFIATGSRDWHGLSLAEQEDLAMELGVSIHQLYRRIKSLRGKLEAVAPEHFHSNDFKKTRARKEKTEAQAECHA